MKNFWLILLMVIFPLQAALAAAETYNSHGHHGNSVEHVLHTHADDAHEKSLNSVDSLNLSDQGSNTICEGDHHHCHGHTVSVLPSSANFDFSPNVLTEVSERHQGYQSHLSNRIDRPKWA